MGNAEGRPKLGRKGWKSTASDHSDTPYNSDFTAPVVPSLEDKRRKSYPARLLDKKDYVAAQPIKKIASTAVMSRSQKPVRESKPKKYNFLTLERRELLRESWNRVVEKYGTLTPGLLIYRRIFTICPQLRVVFKVDEGTLDDLERFPSFVRHARVFVNVLNLSMKNIFELEKEIAPILIMYGRRHYDKHGLGFQQEYLAVFELGILTFVADELGVALNEEIMEEEKEETLAAWRILTGFLVQKIKQGYNMEHLHSRQKHINPVFRNIPKHAP